MSDLKHSISIAGENSLILYFGDRPSDAIASQVAQVVDQLRLSIGEVLIDLVPSYASLLVIYNPLQSDHHRVRAAMRSALDGLTVSNAQQQGSLVILPVYYSAESGPDLQGLADGAGLSVDEVIAIHQQAEYRVYAIGFAPGVAYLGEGSVAIADRQTAVYPAQSPGGWNLIGLCPQRMFDPNLTPSMPVQVGDRVRFDAIDKQTFLALGGEL